MLCVSPSEMNPFVARQAVENIIKMAQWKLSRVDLSDTVVRQIDDAIWLSPAALNPPPVYSALRKAKILCLHQPDAAIKLLNEARRAMFR